MIFKECSRLGDFQRAKKHSNVFLYISIFFIVASRPTTTKNIPKQTKCFQWMCPTLVGTVQNQSIYDSLSAKMYIISFCLPFILYILNQIQFIFKSEHSFIYFVLKPIFALQTNICHVSLRDLWNRHEWAWKLRHL